MFTNTLTEANIILRAYQKEDILLWQKWDTDPSVQAHMPESISMPMNTEEQLAYFEECKNEDDGYYWSIVWRENNALVGTIALADINNHHGIGELGIVVGEKEYWGKGIATGAIKLVLTYAFSEMGLRRITAEYEEGNTGLEKALLKNNFQRECVRIQSRMKAGTPINTVSCFILRK